MLDVLNEANAPMIGLLLVEDDDVRLAREATPTHDPRAEGPARVLERVLRATLV